MVLGRRARLSLSRHDPYPAQLRGQEGQEGSTCLAWSCGQGRGSLALCTRILGTPGIHYSITLGSLYPCSSGHQRQKAELL